MSSRYQLGSPRVAAIFPDSPRSTGHDGLRRAASAGTDAGIIGKITSLEAAPPINGAAEIDPAEITALGALGDNSLQELSLEYDSRYRALWCMQNHSLRPNFTIGLIRDISTAQSMVRDIFAGRTGAGDAPLRYLIWGSNKKNIFNLGGDLIHFVDLLEARDRAGMDTYARDCIQICYDNYVNLDLPIVSIALVQGDALGGGLESALSSDIIIAEKSAQFGFPEILFGLFPGMGAYTYLYRRLGVRQAEQMILSGRIYRGEQLHEMGLIDVLAPDGEGEAALYNYLSRNDKRFNAHRAIFGARRDNFDISLDEMLNIGDRWVDTAMELGEKDIKKMRRLAKAQMSRLKRNEEEEKKANKGGEESRSMGFDTSRAPGRNGRDAAGNGTPVIQPDDSTWSGKKAGQRTGGGRRKKTAVMNFSHAPIKTNFSFSREDSKMETSLAGADRGKRAPEETTPRKNAGRIEDHGQQAGKVAVYARLMEAVAEARAAATLQPGVERLLSEGMDREEYLSFMEQLYHVVWHFCPTMAVAAGHCGDENRELRYGLYHNIDEEKGHESWVLDDIADLGGDPVAVANGKPSVPMQAMIGYNYYVAERKSPWAVLGMVHVLEEISANYAGRVAKVVADRLGVTDGKGFRFLGTHGTMDVSHVGSFKGLIENISNDKDFEALVDAVEVNYALFGALFRDA